MVFSTCFCDVYTGGHITNPSIPVSTLEQSSGLNLSHMNHTSMEYLPKIKQDVPKKQPIDPTHWSCTEEHKTYHVGKYIIWANNFDLSRGHLKLWSSKGIHQNPLNSASKIFSKIRCRAGCQSSDAPALGTPFGTWLKEDEVSSFFLLPPSLMEEAASSSAAPGGLQQEEVDVPFFRTIRWLRQFRWPDNPLGPTGRQTGICWPELALSWMLFNQCYLPLRRKDQWGQERLMQPGSFFSCKRDGGESFRVWFKLPALAWACSIFGGAVNYTQTDDGKV